MLDGCSRADVDTVCNYITQTLGRPLADLKLIVVTHMHPDHAGGAIKLRVRTGAQVACHPKAINWYKGLAGRTAHGIDLLLTWWVASRIGKPRLPFGITQFLRQISRLKITKHYPVSLTGRLSIPLGIPITI